MTKKQKKLKKKKPADESAMPADESEAPANPPPQTQPAHTRKMAADAKEKGEEDESIIIVLGKLNELINVARFNDHSPKCPHTPRVYIANKQLISVSLALRCKCGFKSEAVKMFNYVEKKLDKASNKGHLPSKTKYKSKNKRKSVPRPNSGPRHSLLNGYLAMATSSVSMGADGCHDFLLQIGVEPGSIRGIQDLLTRTGPIVMKKAKESMSRCIKKVVNLQKEGKKVGVAVDTSYNNSRNDYLRGVAMQPASQSRTVFISPETKDVLGIVVRSKVCTVCSKHETFKILAEDNEEYKKKLPSEPFVCKDCTRNLGPSATICDEGASVLTGLQDLSTQGVDLKNMYLVADGDSKIKHVANEMEMPLYRDIHHLSLNLKQKYKKEEFDATDFQGPNDERKRDWHEVIDSVMERCNAECEAAVNKMDDDKKKKKGKHKARGGGVRDKILKAMIAKTQTPILLCHQGICGRACNKNSLVCDGYEEEKKYKCIGTAIKLGKKNRSILSRLIKERLIDNFEAT